MEGKVALITGAAKGLGRAFAEALLDKGAKVCVCDVNSSHGLETERQLQTRYSKDRVFFHKCDVTSDSQIESTLKKTVETYGGLDILCNNAGIGDEKNWTKMMNINMSGMIHGTLIGLKYMGKAQGRRDGVIINISSAAGVLPMPFGPMYTASKHAIVGFTRSIGLLSPRMNGVRINCLCPSFANTDILQFDETNLDQVHNSDPKFAKAAAKMIDMVGVMQPREVAECFMTLVEDETLSGAVLLATPDEKKILQLPMTIPEMFDKLSSI